MAPHLWRGFYTWFSKEIEIEGTLESQSSLLPGETQTRVKDLEVPCAERRRGRGPECTGPWEVAEAQTASVLKPWHAHMWRHTVVTLWNDGSSNLVHNRSCFGLSSIPSGGFPHHTHALIWTLCPRPDMQPSMIEGLGSRVLSHHPYTHTHSPSPVLGYASVITSYCSHSGYGLCSEHLRLRKILMPGPGWPSSRSTAGLGLYGHPGSPQGSRNPEPLVHISCTPCSCLAAPLGLCPCHSPPR